MSVRGGCDKWWNEGGLDISPTWPLTVTACQPGGLGQPTALVCPSESRMVTITLRGLGFTWPRDLHVAMPRAGGQY